MQLVLGTHHFSSLGGSETYLLTISEQLERLGWEVVIFSPELGEMAEIARARSIRVEDSVTALPEECGAVLAQDAVTSLLLTQRYPRVPLVFVTHGAGRELMVPPQLSGVASAVVVMNDRVRARVEAMRERYPVVRLHQPVDTERFSPRVPPRKPPEVVLLFGNNLRGPRKQMIVEECTALGLKCRQLGRHGVADCATETVLNDADIVIGYGRCALEALACGRAVYVFDHLGGDGWVTGETYAAMEADGFGGRATDAVIDRTRLRHDLMNAPPDAFLESRDLVVHRHDANRHAQQLSAVISEAQPRAMTPSLTAEMARLVRLQWRSDSRAAMLTLENQILGERLRLREKELSEELSVSQTSNRELALKVQALEPRLQRLEQIEQEYADFKTTRRYRFAASLARPLDRLRGAFKRGGPKSHS